MIAEGDFSAEVLAARLESLIDAPGRLAAMARAARAAGHDNAAANLARLVAGLVPSNGSRDRRRAA
jgi:UDP-N-acetylglucosamine:LPS N-acetylglucosamine transferase